VNEQERFAREIAARAVEMTDAHEAEAVVAAGSVALTRFANNLIHQNVAETDMQVSVRAVVDSRQGVASTNHLDDASLAACCKAATRAARSAPKDPDFPGLPDPQPVAQVDRSRQATVDFDANARALAARSIIDQSDARGLTAAGAVRVAAHTLAVANSQGVDVAASNTGIKVTVLSSGTHGGSGWASFTSPDAAELAAAALGDEAATLAERSADPGELEPGSYEVVLAAEAVADIADFLAYVGFSARAVAEDRSFMSGHAGEKVLSEMLTIADDALADHAMGPTFDFEGVAKQRVVLVDHGVIGQPVTDSYWAARTSTPNTGHALPAPNPYGPMPLNLEIAPGQASIDELVAGVKRGVYVTRFHYVNVEEPVPVVLTGMTRDGTFMIEDGHLTRPLKNLRFTQGMVEALADVRGLTADRRFVGGEMGASFVPGLHLGSFAFTGQTD